MSVRSTAVRFAVVGAFAAAVTGIAAAPAQAGIYTWHFHASYATTADCQAAGVEQVRTTEAVKYRCSGADATELYLAEIW